jgi:hypothetical protein
MPTELGERLARTIASRDADALKALFEPNVRFRALTPGTAWESEVADAVVEDIILGTWFSPERSVTEILAVDCAKIGSVDRVGYRFAVRFPDGDFIIEQQAYFKCEDVKISWLQILCSGFVRNA